MSDHWSNRGAICPHCEHLNTPDGDNYALYSEECDEWECASCSKEFEVEVFTTYSWTTKALEDAE